MYSSRGVYICAMIVGVPPEYSSGDAAPKCMLLALGEIEAVFMILCYIINTSMYQNQKTLILGHRIGNDKRYYRW